MFIQIIYLNIKILSREKNLFLRFFENSRFFADIYTMSETFWDRTNRLIKECGFTQETLTQKCEFEEPRRIQNLSGGGRFPRAAELVKIAQELKTSVEYLVTGNDLLTELERELLHEFKLLDDVGKKTAIGAVKGIVASFPQSTEQSGELSKTA